MRILYAGTINVGIEKGDSLHFAHLAQALQRRGHDLTVLARGTQVHANFRHLDVHLAPQTTLPKIGPLINDLLLNVAIIKRLASRQFDILYQRGVPMINQFARGLKIPSLVEVNGVRVDELRLHSMGKIRLRYFQFRERQIVQNAQAICVTEGIREQLVKHYAMAPEQCLVIPNAANTHLFRPQPRRVCQQRVGLDPERYNVGFVGAFQHWVDFESLLHAVRILSDQNIPVHCTLVGDGPDYHKVAQRIGESGLNTRVRLVGRAPHETVPDWMCAFDVCVAPFTRARNELIGLSPLKLFEYLACQRPVVATALPGIAEVIEPAQAGLLYPVEDANALARQLLFLYQNPESRESYGKHGREYILKHHNWGRVAERIEAVMHDLLGRQI